MGMNPEPEPDVSTRPALLALVCLAVVGRAEQFPDNQFCDKAVTKLRNDGYDPFPIYSRTAGTGSVEVRDRKILTGGDLRICYLRVRYRESYERLPNGKPKQIPIQGWQSNAGIGDPHAGMVFVNVGNTPVRADGRVLLKGDYVSFDGTKFGYGTLRAEEKPRVEPDDSDREAAAQLLDEARMSVALKDRPLARRRLNEIIDRYPATRQAVHATTLLAKLDGRPLPPSATLAAVPENEARSPQQVAADLLTQARFRAQTKDHDGARAICREIIDRYPDLKEAERAAKLADGLPR